MTVRSLCRRLRDRGPEALAPGYARCAHTGPKTDPELVQAASQLKRAQPTWGAVLIRIQLQARWPGRSLPHPRTLQRWFRDAGLSRPPMRRPPQDRRPGQQPHEVWQVDAVEKQRLADGHQASWLTVTDEFSGAILTAELSPPGAMASGRSPRRPADAAAHVAKLGVTRSGAGRQRAPLGFTQRSAARVGVVADRLGGGRGLEQTELPADERGGRADAGVTEQSAEPWLRDRGSLPGRLVWAIHIQRAVYPAIDGRSRLDAFPGLLTPRRPYRIEQEKQLWKLDRVDEYISQFVWRRWVNCSGLISLYHWDLSVGRAWKGQPVSVRFERSDRSWVIQDSRGGELCRHPAVQLTPERIMGLAVSHRRPGSQKIR